MQYPVKDGEIQLPKYKTSKNSIVRQLGEARVFIVDEVYSMRSEILVAMFQYIHKLQGSVDKGGEGRLTVDENGWVELFGKDNLSVLGGDRTQILPIVAYNCTATQYESTLLSQYWTSEAQWHTFRKNMRVGGNKKWERELLDMAEGRTPRDENEMMELPKSIPKDNVYYHELDSSASKKGDPQIQVEDRNRISSMLYPSVQNTFPVEAEEFLRLVPDQNGESDREFVREVVKKHGENMYIATHNSEVQRMNESVLQRLKGKVRIYTAIDVLRDRDVYCIFFFVSFL